MRIESATSSDRTSAVEPPPRCEHGDDVLEVDALPGFSLKVRFYDGTSGLVDLSRLIASEKSGVFAALRDPAIFGQVRVHLGAVTWPGEIDLAPDAMYRALRESGRWILE